MTLQNRLGFVFRDPSLLERALTHKSFHNENIEQSKGHNECLEFLGDAVLDLALSDLLMKKYPAASEGELSKLRASLVNESVLAELAIEQKLDQYMRLGRGETQSRGTQKPRLLASVFEALVGAMYLEVGFERSLAWLNETFGARLIISDGPLHFAKDYKTRLQEKTQESAKQAPQYVVLQESGPDHDKIFKVAVKLAGQEVAVGQGRSKKQAEQEAARLALEKLS